MTEALATFAAEDDPSTQFKVQFNPNSLKVTVTNTIADKGGNGHQTPDKSATKLDLEIIFDSSDTGNDVRSQSNKLVALGFVSDTKKALPKVIFAWGAFSFVGTIESINETIDFFSAEGTPLRLTAQISLKGLKLDTVKSGGNANAAQKLASSPTGGLGTTGLAQSAGDPRAGRALAAANGLESMRFPGASALSLGGGEASLKGPAGLSVAASGPAEKSAGIGFGASASAGVSASLGAFAGLGQSKANAGGLSLNTGAIAAKLSEHTTANAQFDITGKLISGASADFTTPQI